jgi:hypothetical protein
MFAALTVFPASASELIAESRAAPPIPKASTETLPSMNFRINLRILIPFRWLKHRQLPSQTPSQLRTSTVHIFVTIMRVNCRPRGLPDQRVLGSIAWRYNGPEVKEIVAVLCRHAVQRGSISPLMIFTTCDASANSVAAIAKVTLTRLSLGRSSSIDNFCGVKSTRRNRK